MTRRKSVVPESAPPLYNKREWVTRAQRSLSRYGCQNYQAVGRMMYFEYWYPDPVEAVAIYISERGLRGEFEGNY